jgi:hypothetical protein
MAVDYAKWMEQTLSFSKTLKDISIPGSHDSGMYIYINCSSGGTACNTLTQVKPVLGQLQAGMRFFDLRPVWTAGVLYTGHFGKVGGPLGFQGCDGGTMVDILNDVDAFLSSPGCKELVILKFSHYFDRDADSNGFDDSQLRTLIALVSGMLEKWIYVNPNPAVNRLADIPLSEIIGDSGKVIAVFDGLPSNTVPTPPGMYLYSDYSPKNTKDGECCSGDPGDVSGDLSVYDKYAETNQLSKMTKDQICKLNCAVDHGGDLFLLDWVLTQSTGDAVGCIVLKAPSILQLAKQAIDVLGSELAGVAITSANVPNIVLVDISPTSATDACIGVNQRLGNNV